MALIKTWVRWVPPVDLGESTQVWVLMMPYNTSYGYGTATIGRILPRTATSTFFYLESGRQYHVEVRYGRTLNPFVASNAAGLDFPVGINGILTVIVNGTSSEIRYNKTTAVVGGNDDGLGCNGYQVGGIPSFGSRANVCIGENLVYNLVHDTAEQDAVIDYLAYRGSVSV